MFMYRGYYNATGWASRIRTSETQYCRLLPPGLYALEQALAGVLQSDSLVSKKVHFDRKMKAAGLLRTQLVFYHACVDDDLFVRCVIQKLPSRDIHMTDDQIRMELSKAFLAASDELNRLRTKLADAKNASEQELFHMIAPALTDNDVQYFTNVRLVDAIYSHPQAVLDCVPWPKLLFKKTE
jgi:hypothetical protein